MSLSNNKQASKPRGGRPVGTLNTRDRRSRTGCVGVSYVETTRKGGKMRCFFSAHAGGTNRKYCLDTLGKQEAWRRAVRYRAQYERQVTEGRAV